VAPKSTEPSPYAPATGATLILACRSQKRAQAARDQLFQLLDDELARRKSKHMNTQHGELFRDNLDIQVVSLDLSSVDKVFACADDVKRR
jgi:3-keto steroid reductase